MHLREKESLERTTQFLSSLWTTSLVIMWLVACGAAAGQEQPCTVDIPTVVVMPDYGLVRKLGPEAFVAHDKHRPIRVESVETYRGSRRVLFIVDTAKSNPAEVRKIEAEVISEILESGGTENSFALLTARGPRKEIHFGAAKEDLSAAVHEIEKGTSGKNQNGGVLDAILEGIDWFQPRREGDAIVALTTGIESNNIAGYGRVRDSLLKAHLRLFGFQAGPIFGGYYHPGLTVGQFPTPWFEPNRESLFALTRDTGGFAGWENAGGDPFKDYRLTDDRLRAVKRVGSQLYKAIAEYYGVRLNHPADNFVLELADSVRKDFPQAKVMYPRKFQDCTGSTPSSQ